MKKNLIILLFAATLFSCNNNNSFRVTGNISDAEGETLYLEHNGLSKTTILDSVKLGSNGKYKFKEACPEYPDFYNLRISNKTITFAVDSCEAIEIQGKLNNFATDYVVTGSEVSVQIQSLRKSVMNIQKKAYEFNSKMGATVRNAKIAEIESDIEIHKAMAQKLILENPRSAAAYFAIYQKINNTFLFSPYVKSDRPFCAAVATSYNAYMPEYERTKNIYNLVIDAIHSERMAKDKEAWNEVLEKQGKGYINIKLNDNKNTAKNLSSLEGKVVLIDFSAYESSRSVDYTFALRELYNKYHSRGFEIYQVSLDRNKIIWEQSVENIPWICVRDDDGPNSIYVSSYNVSSSPTSFLMDRNGTIILRSAGIESLRNAIEKSL